MGANSGDRCIMCGNEKPGIAISEDSIFKVYKKLIHGVRIVTGRGDLNARRFNLVVCREDYPKYKKMRNSYVRKEFTYVGLGAVFTALMVIVSASKLLALAYGFALMLFLYLLAQISYMPALDIPDERRKPGQKSPAAQASAGQALSRLSGRRRKAPRKRQRK